MGIVKISIVRYNKVWFVGGRGAYFAYAKGSEPSHEKESCFIMYLASLRGNDRLP